MTKDVVTENVLRHDWNREASVARHPEQDHLATAPAAFGSSVECAPIRGRRLPGEVTQDSGGGYLANAHTT